MSRFSIRNPYLIVVACLIVTVIGLTSVARMPIDLFPAINIPEVVVATFYNGMPPEQIETSITGRFERFFTLASNVEHIESRSLPGVSLIRVYFQPGTNSDSAVNQISNLATAQLRRLPAGTLPPVVLKFDASSLPVCLVTVAGEGMSEASLRDNAQYAVRNQIANVPGASAACPRRSTTVFAVTAMSLTMSGRDAQSMHSSNTRFDNAGLLEGMALLFCHVSPGQCAHAQSSRM